VGAVLLRISPRKLEQTDEWQATRRYMGQDSPARVISPNNPQALFEGQQAA
jgi:hypothetical protein